MSLPKFCKFSNHQESKYSFNPMFGLFAAATAGIYMTSGKESECEGDKAELKSTLKPNEIKGRINGIQYDGNAPIEDRMSFY